MKNLNLLNRLLSYSHEKQSPQRFRRYAVMLMMLLTLGVGQMWAGKGFFDDGMWQVKLWDGGSDYWTPVSWPANGASIDLGVKTTLYLKGCKVNTWSNDDWTTTKCRVYYWIDGGDSGNNYLITYSEQKNGNRTWTWDSGESTGLDYDAAGKASSNGANPGNYTLKLKWKLDESSEYQSLDCGVNFTYPGFTTTSTSQTFDNTTIDGTNDKTISFGTHYGTALTTSNCSITGTNASDFSVQSINESGVTVRFYPRSAGSKTATLTITDAHSKTCTITLTGKTKYIVTYNKGTYGTGDPHTADKVYGTDLTLANSGYFTRTGYHQTAWNTDAAGTGGTNYNLQASYSTEAAITLYPTWTANTYTIHYDPNDAQYVGTATGSMSNQGATWGTYPTLSSNGFSRTGYTFAGWATSPTGTVVYSNGQTLTTNLTNDHNATVTLYAKWTEKSYSTTVAVSPAGTGTTTPSAGSVNILHHTGTSITANANTDYVFDHWTISGGGLTMVSANTANPNTFKATTTSGTITAVFEDKWNLKGGDNTDSNGDAMGDWNTYNPMPKVSDNNYRVSLSLAARTTYNFKIVKRGATRGSGDAFYGKNSGNSFTRGGTTSASGCSTGEGDSYNLHVTTDAAGSYTFTYNISTNTITVGFPTAYTITFDKGTGGSTITATASASGTLTSGNYVASGETVTFSQTASTGYTFSNWYTTKDEGGSVVTGMGASDHVLENVTSNKTVWSRYTANTYAVTFNYSTNGGSKTSGNDQNNATYNQNTISVPTVKKDGYCFNGWYTAASGGVLVIDAEGNLQPNVSVSATQWTDGTGKWKKTGTATVYAQFSIPEVTLTKSGKGLISSMPGYDTVVINYTFSDCVPTGNYNVADTVGYAVNHAHLAPQPTIKYGTGAGVGHDTIIMPVEDGTNYYEVVATLRTGSVRGEGTVIRRDTIRADVESSYLVKIRYQVDGVDIQPEKGWYLYPSFRAIGVNIPKELNGYELDSCRYGVGVTLDHEDELLDGYVTKYCYSENASTITAVYKPKTNTVYFMDAFGKYWYSTKMKIYDYGTSNSYWASNAYGAKSTGLTGDTVMVAKSGTPEIMMASISASTTNFAITNKKMDDYARFHGASAGNEWARVIYRTDFNAATPMFVPVSSKPDPLANGDFYVLNNYDDGAAHYYRGFWVKYSPNIDSTGYMLKVYDGPSSSTLIQSIPLRLTPTGEGNSYELTATLDLEGGKTYGFQFTKATGVSTVATYGKTSTTLTSASPSAVGLTSGGSKCGLTTTSAGDYTFHVYCANFGAKDANNASATDVQGQWGVKVDFATQANDYRVYYADATQTEPIMSQTIHNRSNGLDTVSFFVRKNSTSRVMKFQKFNGSTSAWDDVASGSVDLSGITKDSIYVFYVQQNEGATTISVTGHDYYDGDIYIRTDCVDEHKWDYKQSLENHKMSETDYGMAPIQPFKFSHYYVHWCTANSNVKYVIANKYAPCLTDTVITDTWVTDGGGKLGSKGANIRFMYNKSTNATQRAYLYGSEENDDNYLKLREKPDNNKMQDTNGTTINDIKFTDEKNWIYTADIKAVPGLQAQLTADYLGQRQYFLGNADSGEEILGGTTGEAQSIDLTYDFKTNRLVCAWRPSNDSIKAEIPINADVLIIRKAQGNAEQLRFNNDGKLSDVKYAYGVIQFDYDDMYHSMYRWDYWSYQHCMYYISFPYDVLVSDIMGVGQLGVDWRLQRYNGAKRAKDGWFAGDGVTTFWEDLHAGDTLKAYEGYSLLLNRNRFNGTVGNIWDNKVAGSSVYLYFPSATATTGIVQNKSVTIHVPEHECTLDRPFQQDPSKNHKVVDSHWNMIGTPLFEDKTAATLVPDTLPGGTVLKYVYSWNYFSNTLGISAILSDKFEFKAMYSYMAQFAGDITFSGSTVNRIVAAKRNEENKNYTLNLELTKDDQFVGRTYVELNENAVDSFLLNEDVCMLKNGVNADLYTFAGAYEAGANILTVGNHTVPVGIDVKAAGTYTFSMPDNFDGEVILVDTYAQTRTNLMIEDYELALPTGTIDDRFLLEININKAPTAIDGVGDGEGTLRDGNVHKFIMNDQMYILMDGVMYDATGKRVQ